MKKHIAYFADEESEIREGATVSLRTAAPRKPDLTEHLSAKDRRMATGLRHSWNPVCKDRAKSAMCARLDVEVLGAPGGRG